MHDRLMGQSNSTFGYHFREIPKAEFEPRQRVMMLRFKRFQGASITSDGIDLAHRDRPFVELRDQFKLGKLHINDKTCQKFGMQSSPHDAD